MNDVLEERRIRVRDIVEDLYDGQVLSELMGRIVTGSWMKRSSPSSIIRATDGPEIHYSRSDTVCCTPENQAEDTSGQGG